MSKVPSFENTNKPDKPDGDVTRKYCIFVTHLTYKDFKQHFEFGSVSASGSAMKTDDCIRNGNTVLKHLNQGLSSTQVYKKITYDKDIDGRLQQEDARV